MTPQGSWSLPEASGIKGRQLQQAQALHEAVPMSTSRCARPLNFARWRGSHEGSRPDGGSRNSIVAPGVISFGGLGITIRQPHVDTWARPYARALSSPFAGQKHHNGGEGEKRWPNQADR